MEGSTERLSGIDVLDLRGQSAESVPALDRFMYLKEITVTDTARGVGRGARWGSERAEPTKKSRLDRARKKRDSSKRHSNKGKTRFK